jgi:hypothetical protein
MVDTLRDALLGNGFGTEAWQTLIWSLGLLVVFFPLAVILYQRRTSV